MKALTLTSEQQALLDWISLSSKPITFKTKLKLTELDLTPGPIILSNSADDPQFIQGARHAILEARAGSGKTTTLLLAAQAIIEADSYSTVLVVAFNKRIAEDIERKAQRMGLRKPRFIVQTLHACGNAARISLSEYRPSTLNGFKVSDLVGNHINALRRASAGGNLAGKITAPIAALNLEPAEDPVFVERNKTVIESLVDFGRLYGVGISFQLEDMNTWHTIIERHVTLPRAYTATRSRVNYVSDLVHHACEIIKQCETAASNEHDFIDMLWLPILSGAAFKQYDWVLIDEAQDTNELSRAIGMASLAPMGRMIVVGDPHQCINGFQGADDNGIRVMRDALNAVTFPLTISQRCAKKIVEHARDQTACKDIQSRDDAKEGFISRMHLTEMDWNEQGVRESIEDSMSAVLCRNNAPLLSLGFTLMREGVPFHIAGGADLYGKMLRLATRWKVPDAQSLLGRLELFRATEISRLRAISASSARIDAICDEVDMLCTIVKQVMEDSDEFMPTQKHVTQKIAALKHEQETCGTRGILLSTIHKAKGLEWAHVYLLGADKLMPSSYAVTAFDKSQEDHIRYVAITRAKHALTYLDMNEQQEWTEMFQPIDGSYPQALIVDVNKSRNDGEV